MSSFSARLASAVQVHDALDAAAQVGPFFRLEIVDQASGWLPMTQLDPETAADYVADTARQLGTEETRVAASILQQSFAARLWSPVLGCGLLAGVVPALSNLMVSREPPLRLGLPERSGWLVETTSQLLALSSETVGTQLSAFAAALPDPPADGLLRGNSASAMIGGLGVLISARPDLSDRAAAIATALLDTEDLRGAGDLDKTFRRRSCCLYYRVPGGGLCGDCCFTHPPG